MFELKALPSTLEPTCLDPQICVVLFGHSCGSLLTNLWVSFDMFELEAFPTTPEPTCLDPQIFVVLFGHSGESPLSYLCVCFDVFVCGGPSLHAQVRGALSSSPFIGLLSYLWVSCLILRVSLDIFMVTFDTLVSLFGGHWQCLNAPRVCLYRSLFIGLSLLVSLYLSLFLGLSL